MCYDIFMPHQPTIDTYNTYATVYDTEVTEFWQQFPASFIDEFTQALPGTRILNLGSGSGRDALLLRERGLDVVCLDASKAMVGITTKLGFESHLADFSELPFEPASFDGVWAYTSLIHIPKNEASAVIAHVRQLLKPGGKFAIGVIEGTTAEMVERKTMPGTQRYFKFYTSQELKELIKPAGFVFENQQNYQPHRSIYINQVYGLV